MNTSARQETTGRLPDRTTRDRSARKRSHAIRWHVLALTAAVAATSSWLFTGAGSDTARVSREFGFTGRAAQYVVPAGVCRIRVEAAGGSGGLQGAAGTPGLGARVTATLRVRPEETLLVHVGGQGGTAVGATPGRGGWNGGGGGGAAGRQGRAGSGGGGATDIRRSGGRLEDRVLVAGAGAGAGGGGIGGPHGISGGEGGSPEGHDGSAPLGSANPATGGRGGTPSGGGAPGANAPHGAVTATGGSPGVGGIGASGGVNGGGGGGGGLYGGGGGGAEFQWTSDPLGAAHGGGGSSFGPDGTSFRSGVWGNPGSGSLTISHDLASDACAEQVNGDSE